MSASLDSIELHAVDVVEAVLFEAVDLGASESEAVLVCRLLLFDYET